MTLMLETKHQNAYPQSPSPTADRSRAESLHSKGYIAIGGKYDII
jgi:hypothetical protein